MKTDRSVRRAKALKAGLRLFAMASLLVGLSVWWLLAGARAELAETSLTLGRGVDQIQREHPGTTRMIVNGQALALNSRSVAASVEHVLDRFGELCVQASGDVQSELDELAEARPRLASWLDWRKLGVFRSEAEPNGEAVSGCIAADGKRSLADWIARLEQVAQSGDFGQLGQFRYVLARPSADGSTHVLTVWSEGELNLEQMFPALGDAPGHDLVAGLRPENARRAFSAEAPLNGFASVVYESPEQPARLLTDYDARLQARGYLPLTSAGFDDVPLPARAYRLVKGERLVVIAQPNGAGTLFSTLRIQGGGSVAVPLGE
jgi:hypothetical protein